MTGSAQTRNLEIPDRRFATSGMTGQSRLIYVDARQKEGPREAGLRY
jgi:hypothetical protein